MGNYVVYKHTNKINGRVYVGITCQNLEDRWKGGLGYKTNRHFSRAIKKYGWENFSHDILCVGLEKEDAQTQEVNLIAFYRDSECGCYNILSGGGLGRAGVPMSAETKEKLRNAKLGWKMTEEQRKRLSESSVGKRMSSEARMKMSENNARYWQGKKRDSETIEKIRVAHLGKTLSEDHRAKISASQPRDQIANRKKKAVLQMDLYGNPVKQWPSMKEAEMALRGRVTGGISACCQGKFETAFGYKWKILNYEGEYK